MAIVREYSLNITTAQAQANIEELNASFRAQEALIEGLKSELGSFEQKLDKTSKTELARRKAINEKITETKDKLIEEKDGLKKVTKERKEANNELKIAEENTADYSGVLGIVDGQVGGAISGLSNLKTTITGATKGFNLMKIAIIGTGIGALIIALAAVTAAFKGSEEGQERWNKIMAVIGSLVTVFTDRLAILGDLLISVFTDPVSILKDFGNTIKEFVMDKVDKVIEGLGFMGTAISKLFKGDFTGAMEAGKEGLKNLNDGLNVTKMIYEGVVDGTKKLAKSTADLVAEMKKEAKIAGQISDMRAKADRLDRQIVVDRAEADLTRADLLNKAIDKEKFSLQERIGFLQEAGKLEEEITAKEIEGAKLRLEAKKLENQQTTPTMEALNEQAELEAKLINLTTSKLLKEREVSAQIIGLKTEAAAEEVALEQAKADALESIRQGLIVSENERRLEDLNLIKLDYEEKIKLAEEFFGKETDKVKELREAQRVALAEQQAIFDEEDAVKKAEASAKAAEELALKDEDELLSFDQQRQLIIDRENLLKEDKTISDADKLVLEQSFADKKVDIAMKEADAKAAVQNAVLDTVSNGINVLKGLAGKNKKVQAALLIAEGAASVAKIAVNTGVANAKAVAAFPLTVGQPWVTINSINAGLGIAAAVSATSKGISALGESGSIPKATIPAPVGGAPSAEPPAFNIVGSSGTNQLADAIGGQSQQPVQAFVVASEVTNAQALERNTIEGATIG
tara:strand:+ start:6061 stop:8295 length:2235 start_codon:yes stop_codon:yes gene_type:complete